MLIADWHALANNKMGGDLSKIQTVGRYFIEVWKSVGIDLSGVEFVWASELVKNPNYWKLVLQIAKTNSIRRFIRTAEIMGREESFDLSAAQIIYPCMQTADIFTLEANVTQLGMDQRKVNMLAREVGETLGYWKPIVVSHRMLMGLGKPPGKTDDRVKRTIEMKMSKSKPESSIFMTDRLEDIENKLNRAYCPPAQVDENPIMEYFHYIIFESQPFKKKGIIIRRSPEHGGDLEVPSYDQLSQLYQDSSIHPADLKTTAASCLDSLLSPVRVYFEENTEAKRLKETVEGFTVTR